MAPKEKPEMESRLGAMPSGVPGRIAPDRLADPEHLASELTGRWLPLLANRSWRERLQLLNDMHDQLLDDLGDFDTYCKVSPLLIKGLIVELGDTSVTSAEQAHVYANSSDESHRILARAWFEKHRESSGRRG
ncbi:MAG TPA: hypothetical protein VEU47_17085 [Candidatus Cybelea sp.]|nr:hypothetical protein [Candidatus Cybelea sp.]